MKAIPVILIFDVGKTNKKILLFDEHYRVVFSESIQFPEIQDEDDFVCEDIFALTEWIRSSFERMISDKRFIVRAVNFSAYGASLVYVDKDLKPILPLYNYLKPYPSSLQQEFYNTYGGEGEFSKRTASPVLGSLNSGMQLYRIKKEQPEAYRKIKHALHLPQYLSSILSKEACSEITSIGCHTGLWDFSDNAYHGWVHAEKVKEKLPETWASDQCHRTIYNNLPIQVGVGLHDSSAALIPYLANFHEPFILLSTGTWCISLNPFNNTVLTQQELEQDCLCYLTYQGNPVKASRLFAGYDHEQQVKRLSEYFRVTADYFTVLSYDRSCLVETIGATKETGSSTAGHKTSTFSGRDPGEFKDAEEAYHELMKDIVTRQLISTKLVLSGNNVKRIFVDGGFSKNSIYMHLMAAGFSDVEVFAASVAQASSLGAALAMHKHWNKRPIPTDLIELKSTLPHPTILRLDEKRF